MIIGFWKDEACDESWGNEEGKTDATHKDDRKEPSFFEGFEGHVWVLCAKVLANEGGGCSADGEAGEKAEGFDSDGDEMRSEAAFGGKAGDIANDVGVDRPHAEHFECVGNADSGDAGEGGTMGSPISSSKGQGDCICFRIVFPIEDYDDDESAEDPSGEASPCQT